MKKIISALALSLVLFLTAGIAEAHTLETDGDISGVMHIAPDHKPTATEPAHFEFFMSRHNGKFDPNAYAYTLQISGEGMATTTAPVHADGSTLRADFVFPKEGEDYTASLTGSSTVSGNPSFFFDFDDIFVYPAGKHENPIENLLSDHWAHVALVVLIILAFAAIVAWDRFVERRRKS